MARLQKVQDARYSRLLRRALWALAAGTTVAACSGRSTRTTTSDDTDDTGGTGGSGASSGKAAIAGKGGSAIGGGRGGAGGSAASGGSGAVPETGGTGPGFDGGSGPGPRGGSAGSGVAGLAGMPGTSFPCMASNAGAAMVGQCTNSFWHRPSPVTCNLPERSSEAAAGAGGEAGSAGAGSTAPDPGSQCVVDTDCNAAPHGYCVYGGNPPFLAYFCHYSCESDADCADNQACACDTRFDIDDTGVGAKLGQCVAADCRLDMDCEPGFACLASADGACGGHSGPASYHCQSAADSCGPPGCAGADCRYVTDHFECADFLACRSY